MSLSEDNSDGSKYFIIKIYAASCWAFSWSVCTPGNMRVAICYISHSHKASVSNPLSTSTPGFPYISQNQPLVSNEEVGCKWCHRDDLWNDWSQCLPYTAVSVTQTDIPEAEDPGGAEGLCWNTLRSQVCHCLLSELSSQGWCYEPCSFQTLLTRAPRIAQSHGFQNNALFTGFIIIHSCLYLLGWLPP